MGLSPPFLYINTTHFVVDVWLLKVFFIMSEMCWLIEYHHELICLVVCREPLFDLWVLGKLKATISIGCTKISANREGGNASSLLHRVYSHSQNDIMAILGCWVKVMKLCVNYRCGREFMHLAEGSRETWRENKTTLPIIEWVE